MTEFVQFSPSPQEFSPFEISSLDEVKKRKTKDNELPVAKKEKMVILNSQSKNANIRQNTLQID